MIMNHAAYDFSFVFFLIIITLIFIRKRIFHASASPLSTKRSLFLLSIFLILSLCSSCLDGTKFTKSSSNENYFTFIVQPAHALGDSPISRMDPSDLSLPTVSELDLRIKKFNEWIRGDSSSSILSNISNPTTTNTGNNSNNTTPQQESDTAQKTKNGDVAVPFEVRRVSKESRKYSSSSAAAAAEKSGSSDFLLKVFATEAVTADKPEFRIPAKFIFSLHTICPHMTRRLMMNQNRNQQQQDNFLETDSFCQLVEYLYQELSKINAVSPSIFQTNEEEENAAEIPKFNYEDFEVSMMSLYAVYSRWGNQNNENNNNDRYHHFKPMIDLFPRVPASPVCTFTDADLSILTHSLAKEIETERNYIEQQWKSGIFDTIFSSSFSSSSSENETQKNNTSSSVFSNNNNNNDATKNIKRNQMQALFNQLFPDDALTLPRFFWAQCNIKSKVTTCFEGGTPCVFPILDLAGYRTELSQYGPRHLAKPNTWRGYSTALAYMEEIKVPVPPSKSSSSPDSEEDSSQIKNQEQQDSQVEDASLSSPTTTNKKKSRKLKKKKRLSSSRKSSDNNDEDQQQQETRYVIKKRILPRTNLVEALRRGDDLEKMFGVLKFSYAVQKNQELTLDRGRNAMPFLYRGIIDHNGRSRCSVVNLPTLHMKQKMENFYLEQQQQSSTNNNNAVIMKKKVQNPRTLFQDPTDSTIATLFNPCLGFLFDKSEFHPQLESKINFQQKKEQQQFLSSLNSSSASSSSSPTTTSSIFSSSSSSLYHLQPYTCIHVSQEQVFNVVAMIEGMGVFDANCSVKVLESDTPIESSAETQLRSVALLGKLVRAQLERISTALTKLEETYTNQQSKLLAKQRELMQQQQRKEEGKNNNKNKNKKKTNSKSDKEEKDEVEMNQEEGEESAKKKKTNDKNSNNNNKKKKRQGSQSYQEYLKMKSKSTSANEIEEENDQDSVPRFLRMEFEELSSCSAESPTICKILEDPFPRHLMLIQEYLQNEHSGLLQIYETLSKMREYLRKELENADYLKV